ncbi:MAG: CPBP family intramembrane metalloprotease [Spirochaetales bacterium]|nr:CPBP family intramembrane metalloprotease [Spirochaetales bacterium]
MIKKLKAAEINTMRMIIPAVIIMFIASLGNVLTLVVLKNPVVAFFWYHLFICLILPVLDNFILRKRGLKAYFQLIGLVQSARAKYLILSFITGVLAIILTFISFYLCRDYLLYITTLDFPLLLVIAGSIYTVFLNGFLEEIFWRGYIHSKCLPVKNRIAVILLNSFFFASFHAFIIFDFLKVTLISFIITGFIFLAGILLNFFREKSLSIIPPVILHVLLSIGYTLVFLFLYFS